METVEPSGTRKRSVCSGVANPAAAEASKGMPCAKARGSWEAMMAMFFWVPYRSQ